MINMKGYQEAKQILNTPNYALIPAGGYICHIVKAELTRSKAGKEMLVAFLDVVEPANFKGIFLRDFQNRREKNSFARWNNDATFRRIIFKDGQLADSFVSFLNAVEKSNPNFSIDGDFFDEKELVGKFCGFTFSEEEFENPAGDKYVTVRVQFPMSVDRIRQGKFKIPPRKVAETKNPPPPANDSADDDPFDGTPIDPDNVPF